jgi:polyisoprenoid-binding protein YceI
MTSFRKKAVQFAASGLVAMTFASHATAADAVNWKLDPGKSRLGFSGTQTGTKFQGAFTRYNAVIAFDPDHLEASHIAVTVDLASATTNDKQRDTALPGKDWFDVAKSPTATFETSAISSKGGDAFEAAGTLTLRGVSRPFTLPFTLETNGATAHAKGHAELMRNAFGIGQGPWATDQWVAFEVGIDIDAVATRGN